MPCQLLASFHITARSPTSLRRVDTIALGFRFPPYKPNYRDALNQLATTLPPRPQGPFAAAGGGAKRWAFWLLFALVGAGAVLMKARRLSLPLPMLKASP